MAKRTGVARGYERLYTDKFERGDQNVADRFISNLERTKELETRFIDIYYAYIKYARSKGEIPISKPVFMNIINDHPIEMKKMGKFIYCNLKYIPEDKKDKEEKLDNAIKDLDSKLSNLNFEDFDATSIESFMQPIPFGVPSVKTESSEEQETQNTEEIPVHVITEATIKRKEEKASTENVEDLLKMKQIEIVESFADMAKKEFDAKMEKLDKLKEELIEKDLSPVDLLTAIQTILK